MRNHDEGRTGAERRVTDSVGIDWIWKSSAKVFDPRCCFLNTGLGLNHLVYQTQIKVNDTASLQKNLLNLFTNAKKCCIIAKRYGGIAQLVARQGRLRTP